FAFWQTILNSILFRMERALSLEPRFGFYTEVVARLRRSNMHLDKEERDYLEARELAPAPFRLDLMHARSILAGGFFFVWICIFVVGIMFGASSFCGHEPPWSWFQRFWDVLQANSKSTK